MLSPHDRATRRAWLLLARDAAALGVVAFLANAFLGEFFDALFGRRRWDGRYGSPLGSLFSNDGLLLWLAVVFAIYWLPRRWRRITSVQSQQVSIEDAALASGIGGPPVPPVRTDGPPRQSAGSGPTVAERSPTKDPWSAGPDGETCATCGYFRRYLRSRPPDDGVCRRHPPQYSGPIISPPPLPEDFENAEKYREAFRQWRNADRYEFSADWSRPTVSATAWCGEWRDHVTGRPSCVVSPLRTESPPGPLSSGSRTPPPRSPPNSAGSSQPGRLSKLATAVLLKRKRLRGSQPAPDWKP